MSTPAELIPTTWLDPLLTGPNAVIGDGPYTVTDIENLLRALKKRLQKSPSQAPPKDAEPVGYADPDELATNQQFLQIWREKDIPHVVPLYTHAPDTSAERRDAERYRWIRDNADSLRLMNEWVLYGDTIHDLNASVDSAIARRYSR